MKLCTLLIAVLSVITLLLQTSCIEGTSFQPIVYTFPDGLQSVNGSSSTGGCQESCVMMPIGSSNINGCDCPGSTAPVSGVLVDGDIPSIDTIQRGTWASGLFVVNKNGQDSIMIGFVFSSFIFLRHVEVVYLDCQLWGTGLSTVNVYSSQIFPSFLTVVSTSIGMLSLDNDTSQSCTSLKTISIPLQPTSSIRNYFIEFILVGTSVRPLNWLHLAEIRFSDVAPTAMIPSTIALPNDPTTILMVPESSTTHEKPPITSDHATTLSTTTVDSQGTPDQTTQAQHTDVVTSVDAPGAVAPVSIIVGALVGVILLLILLLLSVIILLFILYVYLKRAQGKMKQDKANGDTEHDDVIEGGTELSLTRNPLEMKGNEAYGIHREDNNTIVEIPLEEAQYH